MRDDLSAALRSLRSSSGVTFVALAVLTLGIGATTAIFSVVDAVVLRGLPFDEHDRLVAVGERERLGPGVSPDQARAISRVSPQNFLDWTAGQRVFESIAGVADGSLTLRLPDAEPEPLVPVRVTAGFFDVLRVRPVLGPGFAAEHEVAGRNRVVVLSDGFWRDRFAADPRIIGRVIPIEDIDGAADTPGAVGYEIVGVMPPGFSYPVGDSRPAKVWVPYVVPDEHRVRTPHSLIRHLEVIARLAPGVSLEQAQAQMAVLGDGIERAYPDWNHGRTVGVVALVDFVVGADMRSWLLMLLAAVCIVLLIACANIASLLLARATARQREIGIRASLGASRWRLVRQLLVESLVLSTAGAALAVVAATWGVQVLKAAIPESVPRVAAIALDTRVLLATAILSVVTAVIFGIVPALQSSKVDLTTALKSGGLGSTRDGARHLRGLFVVLEVALAVVLVVGASLFIGSFVSVLRIDPGFRSDNVLTTQISPRIENRARPRDVGPALEQIVERIGHAPGVAAAAVTGGSVPMRGGFSMTTVTTPGMDLSEAPMAISRPVTPDYHRALRIPLRAGRYFSSADRQGGRQVAILSESTARKLFGAADAIGRTVSLNGDRVVIGVVGDVHQLAREIDTWLEAYVPLSQGHTIDAALVVRTTGDPHDALPAVRAAVRAFLPDVPLRQVSTMEEVLASQIAHRRFSMLLLSLFGILGLAIASVGVYGLLVHLVTLRTREIGVRMALGATRSRMVRMVVGNAVLLVASGLALGGLAAWYGGTVTKAFLFRVEPTDPRAFVAAAATILVAAAAACIVPARRAARVDPIVALRAE